MRDSSSVSTAGTPSPAQHVPDRLEQRAAVLYGVWAVIAGLAHAAGAVALPPGAGLILGIGSALTLGLFAGLARLPLTEAAGRRHAGRGPVPHGIVWATLYTWFGAVRPAAPCWASACTCRPSPSRCRAPARRCSGA